MGKHLAKIAELERKQLTELKPVKTNFFDTHAQGIFPQMYGFTYPGNPENPSVFAGDVSELATPPQPSDEDSALARFPAHLRAAFPLADQIAIGRNLLRLDAGKDIEE